MDFAFSEEQEMLRAAARKYVADRFPAARVAELADAPDGWDPATWPELAQLGWLDPELGFLDHAVIFEESARGLLPAPYFSTVALALPVLRAAGVAWLDGIAAGRRSATLTISPGLAVDSGGHEARLSGCADLVPDVTIVTDALLAVGGAVYHVDLVEHPGVVSARSTMDGTRRLGSLVLEGTTATRILEDGAEALEASRLRGMAAAACEAVGVAEQALDICAEYAKSREQFGRPIGSYQGVSHRIANIYVATELARSLAYWAAWCLSTGDGETPIAVAAAKAAAGEGAVFACENAIQAMGGIGFTWDHVLHRYYKRAQWLDAWGESGRAQRSVIAAALLD